MIPYVCIIDLFLSNLLSSSCPSLSLSRTPEARRPCGEALTRGPMLNSNSTRFIIQLQFRISRNKNHQTFRTFTRVDYSQEIDEFLAAAH